MIDALLKKSADAGVFLFVKDGNLGFKLSVDEFPADLKQEIISRKAELIAYLSMQQDAPATSDRIIPSIDRTQAKLPVSYAQQRMWFMDTMDGGSARYNLPGAFRVTGDFDEAIAATVLQQIVDRHEPLRTTFSSDGEQVWQVIQEHVTVPFQTEDLSHLDAEQQQEQVSQRIEVFASEVFDLSSDVMLRAKFIRLQPEQGVLLFNIHHIAADGWSMGVLMSEFAQLYEAVAVAMPVADVLPPLERHYADYASWQRAFLDSDEVNRQLHYWRERLEGIPQVNSLPLDHERKPQESYHGAQYISSLAAADSDRLKQFASKQNVTLFMLLQSAFALLIARHSQNADVVMGIPMANRTHPTLEPLVGFFVNTLVLRTDCRGSLRFAEFLQQVKRDHIEAQANQDVPFDYLVETLNPRRSTSHAPIFQIMFSMNTTADSHHQKDGWQLEAMQPEVTAANFELTLDVQQRGGQLDFHFIYNTDLFEAASIERLAAHYGVILHGILSNPDEQLQQFPLLTAAETSHLLHELSTDSLPDGHPLADLSAIQRQCVHHLFEQQVAKTPEQTAVICREHSISYAELNARANQLAGYLMEQGLTSQTPVGVCMDRSIELVTCLLGVMKAGGAYVPLDPTYPPQRLHNILTGSGISMVLTRSRFSSLLQQDQSSLRCLELDTLSDTLAQYASENLPATLVQGQHLAYVIYTSGSTGLPKGVEIEHRNTCAMLRWAQTRYSREELALTLASTSINFDLSVYELFLPLSIGTTVLLVDNILSLLEQPLNPTLINTVPSGIAALLDAGRVPASAMTINLAGEPLPENTVNALLRETACRRVVNLYGPSEDTTYSTIAEFSAPTDKVTIGRPILHSQAYILDAHLQLVPKGSVGELYLGGAGVTRGYRNQPELTAERYISSPFDDHNRLYKTGDLVRWLADGNIEYLGRADDQVKIRGFRIELEEICQLLLQHAAVKSAAVVVRDDHHTDKYIAAYVTLATDLAQPESELKQYLQGILPDYMLPAVFVILAEMPLTANGKIDKKALPAPDATQWQADYVAPETNHEKALAQLWAGIFRIEADSISRHANFFELGGHSLLTIRLLSAISDQLGIELSIRDVFEYATLAELAGRLDACQGQQRRKPALTAMTREFHFNHQSGQQEVVFPLSYAQQRLWFIDQLSGGSAHYNIPGALRVQGRFDDQVAEQALQRIVDRHEPLRTVFRQRGDVAEQVIRTQVTLQLQRRDLSTLSAAEQQQAVRAAVNADALEAFDLQQDLLLRARFLRLGEDDGVLLFTMHHIVSDGWSMGVLIDEFVTHYDSLLAGQPDPLPPLTVQYADYAQWQRDYLQGDVLDQQLAFWQETLADLPAVHSLPLDFPRPEQPGQEGGHVVITVDAEVTQALRQQARAQQATLFMLLHAALTLWLSRHSHSRDIVLGTPVANRLDAQLQPLVGFFVNSLVLRTRLPEQDQRFSDYLNHVKTVNLSAQAHQDVPFELLVEALKPERNPAYAPLFQMMFSMNTNQGSDRSLAGVTLSQIEADEITAKFDLIVDVVEHDDGGLHITFEYHRDLWQVETLTAMAQRYGRLLSQLAAQPQARLSELSLLSASEWRQVCEQNNATRSDYPREATLPELVAQQAALQPDRIAVVYGETQLSYGELSAQANRLARYLTEAGVQRGDLVGLYLERSAELIVGMLGILSAGAAYVPLDSSYPAERLAYMVNDSGIEWLLSQSHLPDLSVSRRLNLDDAEGQRIRTQGPAQWLEATLSAEDRAYVMYTSGSTGEPKGVAVNHRNVVRLVQRSGVLQVQTEDIVAQASNHAFDAATFEIWGALTNGARLVGIDKTDLLDTEVLKTRLREARISVLFLTTSVFHQVARIAPETFASLRIALFGGEAVDKPCVDRVLAAGKPEHLLNGYGPTENTTFSTVYNIQSIGREPYYPIGFPLQQSSCYLLDPWGQPVPPGCVGELYVGGDGVADGYWQRPALTAERFVTAVFSDERLYRTGDLVRMRADGALVFVGRADDQIKLRGYRIELGEIEQRLLQQPGVSSAVVLVRDDTRGQPQLCAYVVVDDADDPAVPERLRQDLLNQLPDYMVPRYITPLTTLPLTANGKVDKRALPVPQQTAQTCDYQTPNTDIERQLVQLWSELLGQPADQLSVTGNFFELGGDSILSIQLVSRALQQGLQLTVKQLFAHQTIRALAPHVRTGQQRQASQAAVTGEQPLLPIQHQFLAEGGALHHFNQSVLLTLPVEIDPTQVRAIVEHWYRRHDALRLRFRECEEGRWCGEYQPLDDAMIEASVVRVALSTAELQDHAQTMQRSLNLQKGPLLKVVHYQVSDDSHNRLLLICHHLVVDGVSWRILLDDAGQLLQQAAQGQTLQLAPKTTGYQHWGRFLHQYASSEAMQAQAAYWHGLAAEITPPEQGPLASLSQPCCRYIDAGHRSLEWSSELTRDLLQSAGRAYRTQVNELLLSALLLGLSRWSGQRRITVDVEGHGREALSEDIDLSQTVGWFTSVYPLPLALPTEGNEDLTALITDVKQRYRQVPDHGLGFGILKYLAGDPVLTQIPASAVVFNYLGQFDQVVNDDSLFGAAAESRGDEIDPQRPLSHALNFNGLVAGGQLSFDLSYDPACLSEAQMDALADCVHSALTDVVKHCLDPESGRLSTVDFPLAQVSDVVLQSWPHALNQRPQNIVDVYPATPMQSGLLFHSLLERSAYVTQILLTFDGALNLEAFQQAWQQLVERHAIFRTAFMGAESGQLHQVVLNRVSLPWQHDDLTALTPAQQAQRVEQQRAADHALGFELHQAPLMRVQLWSRCDEQGRAQTQMLWSHHHALSDGWCLGLIFSELQQSYRAVCQGQVPALAAVTPYRDYIAWWQQQPATEAQAWWQQYLSDLDGPTPLPGARSITDEQDSTAPTVKQTHLSLSVAESEALSALARRAHTTVNIVLQAAWSYLLARYSGDAQVVFGTTVSGRPAQLPGVESMIGLFINTVPVSVQVRDDQGIDAWLQSLHQAQMRSDEYSYYPLAEIQREVGISPLFESLLVFENYPVDALEDHGPVDGSDPSALKIIASGTVEATNYPLSITASMSDVLNLKLTWQTARFGAADIDQLGRQLVRALQQLTTVRRVNELHLLNEDESLALLAKGQGPVVEYPQTTCLHEQIEQQAARTPDAIAVVCADERLSYATLNERANQVAHALRAQGVKADSLVGLSMPRSTSMLVGLLGILKAGGAYVPIDPDYPLERRTYMLQDSGVAWVLVEDEQHDLPELADVTVLALSEAGKQAFQRRRIQPDCRSSQRKILLM
ncbi:non-ribosomal peptide synthetase [Gynuella sunshinyii]|uniref:non-ribosomal peptide synthetase n=1 Tax=Gynuella sunshinyii TaxID=1445505 RepID=UPI00069BD17B|nr:non-ribosomal peptide synthetase [Gynuella sunshinyii]